MAEPDHMQFQPMPRGSSSSPSCRNAGPVADCYSQLAPSQLSQELASVLLRKAHGILSYSVESSQRVYGPQVKQPLALTGGFFDPNLSPVTHGDAASDVWDKMQKNLQATVHRRVVVLVQVSGGGKSKVSVDLCLGGSAWPLYVPLRSLPAAGRLAAVDKLMVALEGDHPSMDPVPYSTAKIGDDRRFATVVAFTVAHIQLAHGVHYMLHHDSGYRALDDMHKRLLFVYCQRGLYSDFSGAAAKVFEQMIEPKQTLQEILSPVTAWKQIGDVCIVYDEVTAFSGVLPGYFLHQKRKDADVPDSDYVNTQIRELKQIPAESKASLTAPTDLLYGLRRAMNTLLDQAVPQIMMDTSFSIAEAVFYNEGSAIRKLVDRVHHLPAVAGNDIVDWFTHVFGKDWADQLPMEDMKKFCGRPYLFYDCFLQTALFPMLKKRRSLTPATLHESIVDAEREAEDWMREFINKRVNPSSPTYTKEISSLSCNCFAQAWRKNGVFSASTNDLQRLLSFGLFFAGDEHKFSSAYAELYQQADLKREPLLWKTMLRYYKDNPEWVVNAVLEAAHMGTADQRIGEQLEVALGWQLYCADGKPFSHVFPSTSPVAPTWVRDGIIHVATVHNQPSEVQFAALLSRPGALIFPTDSCGPDIVFSVTYDEESYRVYVQVTNRRSAVQFSEALYSIEPYLFYTANRVKSVKDHVEKHTDLPAPSRHVCRAFSRSASLDQRFARLIVSLRVSGGLSDWMLKESRSDELKQLADKPVLLAETMETSLKKNAVMKRYVAGDPIKSLSKPRSIKFLFPSLNAEKKSKKTQTSAGTTSSSSSSSNSSSSSSNSRKPQKKKQPSAGTASSIGHQHVPKRTKTMLDFFPRQRDKQRP